MDTTTTCSSEEALLSSPAIKALGSLFKLTEIFICSSGDNQHSSNPKHVRFKVDNNNDDDNDGEYDDSGDKDSSNNAGMDNNNADYLGEESNIVKRRYWLQRYALFSKFDDGIKLDKEGWFSVTHEAIARHHASRCGGGAAVIIDCFTGAGGNAIQFAKLRKHVIAIEIDPKKIEYARHNAAIYGVEDEIDFMIADSLTITSKLKADVVFLSPPWGGPDYVQMESYSLDMLQPYAGKFLFDTCKVIGPMIIMYLPKNIIVEELAEVSLSADPPWSLEVEKNFLNGKLIAFTVYFRNTSFVTGNGY